MGFTKVINSIFSQKRSAVILLKTRYFFKSVDYDFPCPGDTCQLCLNVLTYDTQVKCFIIF